MKKLYSFFSLAAVSVMALSSCSRSDYAFKSGAGSYHTQVSVVKSEPVEAPAAVEAPATAVAPQQTMVAEVVTAKAKAHQVAKPVTSAKVAKLVQVEKAMTKKLVNKVSKHSETAGVSQTQSKAGKAAIVAAIGLVLLLLGGVTGVGIIGVLGLIAFIVGVVMLIIALINS